MKPALFIALLICVARFVNAQRPVQQHIIVCISLVNDAGKPLSFDDDNAVEIETIPDLSRYSRRVDDFSETLRQNENDSSFYFETYSGKPARIGRPFSGRHYIMSGILQEFVITRPGQPVNSGMRIILLNNNQSATGGRVPVYFMENIVFRPGTYEIDCSRFAASKSAVYDNRVQLQLLYMSRRPRKKNLPTIPAAAFYNYRLAGYRFYQDSLFKYNSVNGTYPHSPEHGNGRYRLTPRNITFFYMEPEGKKSVQTAMPEDSATVPANTIIVRVSDERDGSPVPGAFVKFKGSRQGSPTDGNGTAHLSFQAGAANRVLEVSALGYESKEIQLMDNGNYQVNCQLRRGFVYYIDSGTVQKGVFTDFTKDHIGIYWLNPGETFSVNNQEQMSQRVFYEHKRFRPLPIVLVD